VAAERRPEPQDHATSLEKADLLVGLLCAAPAHRLIKRSGPGQIGDVKGYQTDALLHLASIAVDHETQELCCHLYAASARRLPDTDRPPGVRARKASGIDPEDAVRLEPSQTTLIEDISRGVP
jgi:hypothetical protein